MPLTTSEMITRLTEDIESLKNIVQLAVDEGFVLSEEMKTELKDIDYDLQTAYDEDYCDIELMED